MKKMRKWMLGLVCVILICTGCGSKDNDTVSSEKSDSAAENSAAKVAMVTPQKLGDNGPIDALYDGLVEGGKTYGLEVKVLEPEPGEYEDVIRAMCDDGYGLIISIFTQMQDAVSRVAGEYPDVKFVQVQGDLEMDNVRTLNFKDQEGAFLSGVVAAQMSKAGKVSVIAGAEVGDNIRNIAGFEAGAKEVRPDIETTHLYVGSFEDPTKGKELANTLLSEGYDVILQVCASSSLGIREAIKEKGGETYMIGNCVDESKAIPGQVPCSTFTDYKKWILNSMKDFSENKFEAGVFNQGIADGVVDCIFASDDVMQVPDEIKKSVEDYKKKIIDGDIVPPSALK